MKLLSLRVLFCIGITVVLVGLVIYFFSETDSKNKTGFSKESVNNKNEFSGTIPNGFGVSVHFTGDPVDINLISDAGFKIVRMDLFWETVEKKPGIYDFKDQGYDRLTKGLIKEGIRPYYILDYSNKLYEKNRSIVTKKGQEAFVRYVSEATSRYKNNGIIWEIWNEPNISFWEPKPNYDEYSTLVKMVSKVIKKNDPSGIVVAPALAGLNGESLKWLEEIFKRGTLDYIDAISVHPYRDNSPETVANGYQSLRVLIAKYTTKEIPIVSGEWGYTTAKDWHGQTISGKQQAEYLVRMFMINTLYDIPISIWYGWKNDGTDPYNSEHNFGIVQNNIRIPKEAYMAVNNLTYTLSGYSFTRRIDVGDPNDYVMKFTNGKGNTVIVLWTVGDVQQITLPDKSIKGQILSIYGEPKGILNEENKGLIEISNSPKYIIVNNEQ